MSDASFVIPPDHPCLAGHFPGNPIVPAVVLLDHALAVLCRSHPGEALCGLRQLRLRRKVLPGEAITVRATPGKDGDAPFTATRAGELVLSGIACFSAGPSPRDG